MNAHSSITPLETTRFETERRLIGALLCMQNPAANRAAAMIVKPDHFSEPMYARVFHLLTKDDKKELQGPAMVAALLHDLHADESVLAEIKWTPEKLVANCVAFAAPGIALEYHARTVKYAALDVMLTAAAEDGDLAAVQSLGAEMEALSRAQYATPSNFEPLAAVAERVLTELSVAYQAGSEAKDFAVAAPSSLGRQIGHWRRKRFYVIAGRPGMGKSTLALSSLVRTALRGYGVLMFSLEMGEDELTEIALCDLAWTPSRRIEYNSIRPNAVMRPGFAEKYGEVQQVAPMLGSAPFYICDKGGLTIGDIRSQALTYQQRLHAMGKRLDVLCVDHLGLIKPTGNYRGNKVAETEEVSAALKQLAKELDCAVVALAQLSRQTEGREDKRPTLSDLRWSGGIEQDADVVMMVYREEYYLRKEEADTDKEALRQRKLTACKNTLQVFVEKNRGGPTGEVKLFCDIGCGVVRNLEGERNG